MKKGSAIGISVAVLAVAIIVGIASIPDEVLLENPSLEMSDNPIIAQEPSEEPVVEEPVMGEPEEESDGEKIKIEIRDGVGSGDQ